ncbi:MAG: hypothetical protein J6A07_05365 [Firmicutes bacterium]|nr:hypothetical protein [Bacillota bacterium]
MRDIIFAKYSSERSADFAIKTVITLENGVKRVEKYPLSEKAAAHVQKMAENRDKINAFYGGAGLKAAPCEVINKGVAFDYIVGETFEEKLEKCGSINAETELMTKLRDRLYALSGDSFERTAAFDEVFGGTELPNGLHAGAFCCFDLAFGNIIIDKNGESHIIDYEWCFDFPVPVEYIFYRAVKLYVVISGRNDLIEAGIYEKLGFGEDAAQCFDSLETAFQAYIRGDVMSLRDLYSGFEKKNYSLPEIMGMIHSKNYAQVYFDRGSDYSEDDSYRVETDGKVSLEIALTGEVKACRLDPLEEYCAVFIEELTAESNGRKYVPEFITNGARTGNVIYFDCDDPLMIFDKLEEGTEKIKIDYSVSKLTKQQVQGAVKLLEDNRRKDVEAAEINAKLAQKTAEYDIKSAQFEDMKNLADERQKVIDQTLEHVKNITGIFESEKTVLINEKNRLINEKAALEAVLAQREKYISDIENSRAWKAITKMRSLMGK